MIVKIQKIVKKRIKIVQSVAAEQYELGAKLTDKNYPSLELVRLEKLFLKSTGKEILEYGFGSGVNTIHLFVSKLKFFDNCIWVEIGFPHRFIVESPKGFYLLEKGINWMMIYSQ